MSTLGVGHARVEGQDKVHGSARYTADLRPASGVVHCAHVGATINVGRVTHVDVDQALRQPGVLGVLWHGNAVELPDIDDSELLILQSADVHYRGQIVAAVIADSAERARAAADALTVHYESEAKFDNVLTSDHPDLYAPEEVNAGFPTDSIRGEPEDALAAAEIVVDHWYSTPAMHNNPMEPHASTAAWEHTDGGESLTVWDSTQAPAGVQDDLATLFGIDAQQVRVIAEHVGGGFGGKGSTRPNAVLAVMAAKLVGRPVRVVLPRSATFAFVGYRTPTYSRVALGADAWGKLSVVCHDTVQQTSKIVEFVEQTAEGTRHIYGSDHSRTTHRVAALDVSTPRWMRAPGEAPGIYALETAIDELAHELGMDPIELRILNEPASDPATGTPFSSRSVVEALRTGADQFGWADRNPRPAATMRGRKLIGSGVALASYPAMTAPSTARACANSDGTFDVSVAASDIGTGARTVLTQIAADALEVAFDSVRLHLGDSKLPKAPGAGGSSGTSSWGFAVHKACRDLHYQLNQIGTPETALEVVADTTEDLHARAQMPREAFGAQFAQVAVDVDTGEVTVERMLGVFAVGKVLNPRLARSQLLGGMTFGIGMALMEEGHPDARYGGFGNENMADYHVPAHADVLDVEAIWIDEDDDQLNPMGSKGIGEIGNVGSAAAIANAVFHATAVRVRDLPVRPDKLAGRIDPTLKN
ncbi:xanthine dehydrogenase family protein molybdopterin-binding subunit [Nocardia sp. 348MFTsu5.1]|uniref:xanthine dehydrogenase family protein molybdopterin-binding subunit n=1 Tax=Nocardia sp. 348MFTsu5.1 TaxID=1172185 RepID=UPI00036B236C|nr:xanthine dehydrogenase family protein molybdopterin-binding subunit [Nocardia sp. 348MFTsu5.1]